MLTYQGTRFRTAASASRSTQPAQSQQTVQSPIVRPASSSTVVSNAIPVDTFTTSPLLAYSLASNARYLTVRSALITMGIAVIALMGMLLMVLLEDVSRRLLMVVIVLITDFVGSVIRGLCFKLHSILVFLIVLLKIAIIVGMGHVLNVSRDIRSNRLIIRRFAIRIRAMLLIVHNVIQMEFV